MVIYQIKGVSNIDILETCGHCEGKGEKWIYGSDTKELGVCEECNGKGKVLLVNEHLIYKLESANRYINLFWDILKHKMSLDYEIMGWFEHKLTKTCEECNGKGDWWEKVSDTKEVKVKCQACKGYGKIEPTKKDYYNAIFQKYLDYKQIRNKCREMLDNKEWGKEEFKDYKPKRKYGSSWVCVKCEYLFVQCCTGCTPYCCNSSMCTDTVGFAPINERAKQWYNNGGYKLNLNYNPRKNYKI